MNRFYSFSGTANPSCCSWLHGWWHCPLGSVRRHITTASALLYGFYALLQFVPITIGYLNMLGMSLLGQRFYKDHYSGAEAGAAAAMALRMQHEMNGAPGR